MPVLPLWTIDCLSDQNCFLYIILYRKAWQMLKVQGGIVCDIFTSGKWQIYLIVISVEKKGILRKGECS